MSKDIKTFDYQHQDGLNSARAPKPVGPYPHARRVGNLLFLSGVGPRQAGRSEIPGVKTTLGGQIEHDIVLQTKSVIDNIKAILEDCGSNLEQVVDVQVFLTDMKNHFEEFNRVYGETFAAIGPARTTIEVSSLPTPIAVEFKVIATID